MSKKNGLGKLVAGIGIGAGLGMLFAPKKGSELREDLKKKINELTDKVKEIDVEEVKKEFNTKVDEIKNDLEDLDKEKALKLAKEKGALLKTKTDELVELAKEKGTPVLEGIAEDLRQKAIEVTKDLLKKLESAK